MLRGLGQAFCASGPGDPPETGIELCWSTSCGGVGQCWTAALAEAGSGMEYALLEEVATDPPQSCQSLHRTGKQTLGGHRWSPVCTRTQERGAVTPWETNPDLPVSVRESPAGAWVHGSLLQGWGTGYGSAHMGSFEGDHHCLHYLHHSFIPDK